MGRMEANVDIGEQLRQIVAEEAHVPADTLDPECRLDNDLNLDSLEIEGVLCSIHEIFGVELDAAAVRGTLNELVAAVEQALSSRL